MEWLETSLTQYLRVLIRIIPKPQEFLLVCYQSSISYGLSGTTASGQSIGFGRGSVLIEKQE
jgi:hypothetical protein